MFRFISLITPLSRSTISNSRSRGRVGALLLLAVCQSAHAEPKTQVESSEERSHESPSNKSAPSSGEHRPLVQLGTDAAQGPEVSLKELLQYADEHSPVLSVARSTRSRAEAAQVAASVLLPNNPELSFSVGPRQGRDGTGLDLGVGLSLPVQIAGERGMRREAAERLRNLTDAEIEQLRWGVHCDVHEAFQRSLIEHERKRLAERVVQFQREVLRVVERQIALGESAPVQLRLAQAEVAQAEQRLLVATQALWWSRLQLSQLAGWNIHSPPSPQGELPEPRAPLSLAQLVRLAEVHWPQLKTGAAKIREAEARAQLAAREAWPSPSLGIQYQREGNPSNEGPHHTVLGSLSIPIPSLQLNQGEKARARADVTVASAELQAQRRLLEGQIAQAQGAVIAAGMRVQVYAQEILPRFEENLRFLQRALELGEIDVLALSLARERFLSIQNDVLLARQEYGAAWVALERVVGVELMDVRQSKELSP